MQYKLLLVIILAGAYDTIHQVLGSSGYEVSDCGHHAEHITTG